MNFYDSVIDAAQDLPMEERGLLYAAVLEYLYYGREPDFDAMTITAKAVFIATKPNLDNQIQGRINGKKGGRPRKQKRGVSEDTPSYDTERETEGKPPVSECGQGEKTQTKPPVSKNAPFSKSEQEQEQELKKPDSGESGKERRRRFVRPTAEEVDAYIAEMGYTGFTGQQLVDHYEANGWMRGKTPIRDWKACVRTWANSRRSAGPRGQPQRAQPLPDFSAYDLVEEAF